VLVPHLVVWVIGLICGVLWPSWHQHIDLLGRAVLHHVFGPYHLLSGNAAEAIKLYTLHRASVQQPLEKGGKEKGWRSALNAYANFNIVIV